MIAMKFGSLLSAAALLLAACSPAAAWTDHVYKPQHFAVAFTAPPTVDPDPNPFLVEQNDGAVDFGVTAVCNIASGKGPDQMMSDAIEGTRLNGTVRNITYTASGSIMGREMLVDRAGATTVKQRIFVKDRCMYLVFGSSKDGPDDAAVTHFLDSFRML